MKKRTLTLVVSLLLVAVVAVGGTLAWLTDKTESVKNVFTPTNIDVTLAETKTDFDMVPGNAIAKDPVVTVEGGSEACWLFVKVEKSANYDKYLAPYTKADGWTELETGVFYREVEASENDQSFAVLKDNKVIVLTTVTKADMEAIDGIVAEDAAEDASKAEIDARPTLTFTAYAIQKDGFETAALAWAEASK